MKAPTMIQYAAQEDFEEWMSREPLRELSTLHRQKMVAGERLVDLSMINPDLSPPRIMLDRLVEATMKSGNHRYAVSRGIRKLRMAFAEKYQSRFGVSLNPDTEVCATMGTKDAILHGLLSNVKPGANVLLASPTYPAHQSAVHAARLSPYFFALRESPAETLKDIRRVLRLVRIDAMILNFPNNPTGIAYPQQFFEEIASLQKEHGFLCINDFVYGEMLYGEVPPVSLLRSTGVIPGVVESYSLSKAYSAPGWRVGALVGDAAVVTRLAHFKSHADYGIFLPLQGAASAALQSAHEEVRECVRVYQQRANVLVRGLRRSGWEVRMPDGGASVWARMPPQCRDQGAAAFAYRLLGERGIAVTPGTVFGSECGEWIRFALVAGESSLHKTVSDIDEFCNDNRASRVAGVS